MKIPIPTIDGNEFQFTAELGKSAILLGANGSGKTHLSLYIREKTPAVFKEKQNQVNSLSKQIEKEKNLAEEWKNKSDQEVKLEFEKYEQYEKNLYAVKVNGIQKAITGKELLDWHLEGISNLPPPYNQYRSNFSSAEKTIGGNAILYNSDQLPSDPDLALFYKENGKSENARIKFKKLRINQAQESVNNINLKLSELKESGETKSNFKSSYRISAHRSLSLNPHQNPKLSRDYNNDLDLSRTQDNKQKSLTALQTDFDIVIEALLSEEAKAAIQYRRARKESKKIINEEDEETSLSKALNIWNELLPDRKMEFTKELKLKVEANNAEFAYSPSEMSDGERNILYVLAKCLLAPENSLFIIDEPELHIHRSILAKLWTRLQKERSDCFFLFITHDLEFARSFARSRDVETYILKKYEHENKWDISKLEEDEEVPEEIRNAILGSRERILFVEGEPNSLDKRVYERVYPDYTIVPAGSCENVKKYTRSFNDNTNKREFNLHKKFYGIIDRDDLNDKKIRKLKEEDIYALDVATIENIFFMEKVLSYLCRENDSKI